MTASPSTWFAFVRSDVYARTSNEDGTPREELSFYVVCENERGVRYASCVSFTTEEYGREASLRAERFCAKVKAGLTSGSDPSKSSRWSRIAGCYGSAAYSEEEALEDEARALEGEAGPAEADRFRRTAGIGW